MTIKLNELSDKKINDTVNKWPFTKDISGLIRKLDARELRQKAAANKLKNLIKDKDMTTESIEQLISQISQQDESASDTLQSILSDKILNKIEEMKRDVMAEMVVNSVEAGTAAVPTANSPASDDNLKHGKKFKDTVKIGV